MMREDAVSIARLPVTNRDLFGREAELAWLDACWEERVHVASIVAWGGIGKTALVNRWLAEQRDKGWDGAARVYGWSFYSQGTDRLGSSDEFVDAALRWFGDPDPTAGSPWDKGERLARLVRKERTLLVLDGVEPLQWGPGVQLGKLKDPALEVLVKELAAQNKGLCLISTRVMVADLEGLVGDKIRSVDLGSLSPAAGAELLKARGAKGSEEELREAADEYNGHGLALTLLGGYIRKRHRGDIRQRAHIPVLEGRPAQRMMGIYERWFAGKAEIAILRLLGLFDRPTPADEIAALRAMPDIPGLTTFLKGLKGGAWNEAVTTLQDVGLLAPTSDHDDRLDAHPLVREHFGQQLRDKHLEAWREGHRRLYVYLSEKAEPLPETVEEMAPLYAAVVHGCLAGKNQEALDDVHWERIRRGGEHFSTQNLGAFGSEVAVISAFFDPPWERLAAGLRENDESFVLSEAGFALRALGRLPEAAGLLRLSLERYIAQESWKNAAVSASNLSQLLQAVGELSEALEQARKSVELADTSGDAVQRVINRTTLAAALQAMGLREEAARHFEEAEGMLEDIQPAHPLLYSLQGFQYCDSLLDQDRDAEVRERAEKFFDWRVPNDPLLDIALDHLSLGRAHLLALQHGTDDDLAHATSHLQQAVDGLRRAGQQDFLPLGLLARAALHIYTHNLPAARHDLDEALTLATRCGFRLHEADAHLGHARLALAEHHPSAAREHLAKARNIVDATGYHRRDRELDELEVEAADMPKKLRLPEDPTVVPPPIPLTSPAHPSIVEREIPMTDTFDIAIVCALHEKELDQVKRTAPEGWVSFRVPKDPTTYEKTTYVTKSGKRLHVVAAAASQMGMPASAVLATKMLLQFRPKLMAMVGIAAGVSSEKQEFGDILAPHTTFDYASGKITGTANELVFDPDPTPLHINANVKDRLANWRRDREQLDDISKKWNSKLPPKRLLIHTDPLGSGPSVLGTAKPIADIREHWRKLGGIEMEAHGVHLACRTAGEDTPFLCIKSICDFADGKTDDWQDYAAFTAAQFCHRFLTAEWETLFPL